MTETTPVIMSRLVSAFRTYHANIYDIFNIVAHLVNLFGRDGILRDKRFVFSLGF